MLAIQLDFFKTDEECKIDLIQQRTDAMQQSLDKVRKKLFAENGKHEKRFDDLYYRLEIIERNICHEKY